MLPTQTIDSTETMITPAERYERGLALKNAGLYKAAIDQFDLATPDPALAVKAYAQIGLCFKISGQCEEAVGAFRKALSCSTGSPKEVVQILYVLGRTLEAFGRVEETLEAYRWIRREDPGYRDVADRIAQLSSRRLMALHKKNHREGFTTQESSGTGTVLKSWQSFLGIST